MRKLVDFECPSCCGVCIDVWVESAADAPTCLRCDETMVRVWLSAPGIAPNGLRAERSAAASGRPRLRSVKEIAVEKHREIDAKMLRYSDPTIAEKHIAREADERAGIADARGNIKPIKTPPPFALGVTA